MSEVARPLVTCPECGQGVPPGEFCGACGAHFMLAGTAAASHRRHAFAAHPGEHVLHLSVVSTLLPHLPHRRSIPFRIALLLGAALLAALGLARMPGPALAASALLVPALYLLYLYEVEVYADEPVRVIGSTFVAGLLLGIPWALAAGPRLTEAAVAELADGTSAATVLVAGVLAPCFAQALMLLGALVLYLTRRFFDEALDGFAFGAAGALGFTLATTLLDLLPTVQQGLFATGQPMVGGFGAVQRGLLLPLLNASTTGLVAGALWLRRGEVRVRAGHRVFGSVPVAVAVALAAQSVTASVGLLVPSAALALAANALVVAVLLVWVRLSLHHMLMAEATDVEVGPDTTCSHCHHLVPRMAFCPHCGIATRATPKSGAGRQGRAHRRLLRGAGAAPEDPPAPAP